jgi:hypothetical protein
MPKQFNEKKQSQKERFILAHIKRQEQARVERLMDKCSRLVSSTSENCLPFGAEKLELCKLLMTAD